MSFLKCFLIVLLFDCTCAAGQSLLFNGSFEKIESCPDDFFQIYKSESWFSPDCAILRPDAHGYAVLFSGCSYTITGVPNNVVCTQYARTGGTYAGIEVVSAFHGGYRQYIETKLIRPLVAGRTYYFTMYFNLCEQHPLTPGLMCFNPDRTGVKFMTEPVDKNPYCRGISFEPDVFSDLTAVKADTGWNAIQGCYKAKGGEDYLMIGNFGGDTLSNCSPITSQGYFIFIDDVGLIEEVHNNIDTVLCTTEKLIIDATSLREEYKTIKGWNFAWSDGDTSSIRTFSTTTRVKLTASLNGCFTDTYDFSIKSQAICECQVFVPSAFSPNRDAKNDIFTPTIKCINGDVYNYHFTVFNRWGQRVFETRDRKTGWDGMYNGYASANEVYAWLLSYDIMKEGKQVNRTLKGTVLAIR